MKANVSASPRSSVRGNLEAPRAEQAPVAGNRSSTAATNGPGSPRTSFVGWGSGQQVRSGRTAKSSASAAVLVRGLQSRTIRERVKALDVLDRKTLPAVLDCVLANLNHRSAVVRQAAADCLGRLEVAEAVPALLALLPDASSDVRCSAVEALGSILDSTGKCPPELLAMLSDDDEFCRLIAVESIGMIGDRKVLGELWMRMDDTEPLVRRNLAAVIGELGRRPDRARLRRLLAEEPAEMARAGILEGLYELGETTVFPQLLLLLESEDYLVQCFMANALGELALTPEKAAAASDRLRTLRKKSTSVAVKEAAAAGLRGLRRQHRPRPQEPTRSRS